MKRVDPLKSNTVPKILALVFVAGLAFSNYYLYSSTIAKLESYKSEPPFLRFDFTDSYLEDRSSQAPYLADGNPKTEWRKLRPSSQKSDFDLELRLTHRLKDGIYLPSPWKEIQVSACSTKTPKLKLKIVLREAINVDKESRLPDDTDYETKVLDFSESDTVRIPLHKEFSRVPQKDYPKGISIWAVQGNFDEIGRDVCLKDIQVLE
ncbi:hypothetical protein [Leptospira semungkisensis]|uniref:hypothetical protein n=1 Tax=Leptospira semungkisensis TaxID=2484985 RepID=UPI001AEFAD2F|nr:hypothetical protein [Leptospira semungkisensis]